jgi:hypothetical protein
MLGSYIPVMTHVYQSTRRRILKDKFLLVYVHRTGGKATRILCFRTRRRELSKRQERTKTTAMGEMMEDKKKGTSRSRETSNTLL